jgi:hypothetical protein
MVCIMQTAAVASTFPSEEEADDIAGDFAGVGAGNLLAGLAAVALTIAVAALAAGLLAYVPQAALSGVLITIALRPIRIGEMIRIYRRGGL